MKRTIRFKLFSIFLAATLLIVSGMYIFMRWSLHQGFSEFVEARQKERISNLVEGLSDYFAAEQSWNNLANNKQKWIHLLLQANPHRSPPPWVAAALADPSMSWPPDISNDSGSNFFIPLELRVMLLDQDKKIIYGREDTVGQLKLLPIEYQNKTSGYLGIMPGKPINHISETKFLEKQLQSFIWIALIMIGLSAGLSIFLSYMLGRQLSRITSAAKALAVGHYDVRLPVSSNDELGQLARDFNDMAAALQESEQARRRWVADISHELRTPLAVLRGELEALQDGIRPLDATAVDFLFADVMRINRLTEDLYTLSLSDQGALSYRKKHVNPIQLLKEDLESLRGDFQRKNIRITWQNRLTGEIAIYADPDRLSQLYRNLLKNSAAYTNQNGKLIIDLAIDNSKLHINFTDSAPGIPASDLPKLFDRFYRQDSSLNQHPGGAGLGLAICGNIVKAHNGRIEALPSPLQGLTVHLEFPLST